MKKRLLSLIVILILLFAYFTPIALAVEIEETEEIVEQENTEELENIQQTEGNDQTEQIQETEEAEQADQILLEEDKATTIKNVEQIQLTQTIEEIEEDFSIYAIVDSNRINPYVKNNINYIFLPKSAYLSNL